MRLAHVLMVIAASFLVTSEALSTTTDSNQVEKMTPLSRPSQRLLRSGWAVKDEDDSVEEERGPLSRAQVKALVKELDIDWRKVKADPMYLQRHEKYQQYLDKMNEILAKQKSKGAPIYKNP